MRIFSLFTYLQDEVDADVVPEDAQFENGIITPGILNIGNTCYISAAVQLLLSIPQFVFKLSNWYEKLSPKRDLPLTKALLKIALTMGVLKQENVPQSKPPCPEAADPSALKKLMGKLKENEYNGNNQEDSHEFLRDLIGCLHEELDGGDKELIDDIEEERLRWKWMDAEEDEFLEFRMYKSAVTNETILEITDYCDDDEVQEQKDLWETQVSELRKECGG